MFHYGKLVDGYALNSTDGYGFTTKWVAVHSWESFSFDCVFTGGTPVGTLQLQQSNDRPWQGINNFQPLTAAGQENSSGVTRIVPDVANVPGGWGAQTAAVNGAGTYVLDQRLCPFGWVRVVYTASSNSNTQLDIFMTLKNY
jgi:hypothetical protein